MYKIFLFFSILVYNKMPIKVILHIEINNIKIKIYIININNSLLFYFIILYNTMPYISDN